MARIFISYKRKNKEQVFALVKKIENEIGVKCWVDLDGIESSAQFASVICKAIDSAEVVLFMHSSIHLSIDFENDWTVKELNYAKQKKKRIVLVKLDASPLDNIFLLDYGSKNNIDSQDQLQIQKLVNDLEKWLKLSVKQNKNGSSANIYAKKYQTSGGANVSIKETGIVYPEEIPETWTPLEQTDKNGQTFVVFGTSKELAEKGYAEAQYRLGIQCFGAILHTWWQGELDVVKRLSLYNNIKRNCNTPNGRTGEEWFLKAAAQGYKPAIESISVYYYYKGNTQKAVHYGLLASKNESIIGAWVAYKSYQSLGKYSETLLMMERAVEIYFKKGYSGKPLGMPDDFDCCLDLAIQYHKTDVRKAIGLMERVGNKGLPALQYTLATYYEEVGQSAKANEKYKYVAEHFGGEYKEKSIKKLSISGKLSYWWNNLKK